MTTDVFTAQNIQWVTQIYLNLAAVLLNFTLIMYAVYFYVPKETPFGAVAEEDEQEE